MSHITKEHLEHLAKLARIQLTPEDEAKLLPQLENIIAFVGQLQEIEVDPKAMIAEARMSLNEGVEQSGLTEKILTNPQHPLVDQAISVNGKLSEK